jgi:hypothetical protein
MSEETKTDSAVDWIFSQLPDEYTTTPHGFDVYIIAKAMERDRMDLPIHIHEGVEDIHVYIENGIIHVKRMA